MNGAGEPLWLDGRILAFLVEACRRDHRVPLVDPEEDVAERILVTPVRAWEAGERHLGRLGATLFGAIERTPELGGGRLLLATVSALVFWELNGVVPSHRPGVLFSVVRRAVGQPAQHARIAQLAGLRTHAAPG
ncbi:MAG: hypothetical protein PVH00_11255 [Gemmatimonadota bacterium]